MKCVSTSFGDLGSDIFLKEPKLSQIKWRLSLTITFHITKDSQLDLALGYFN